MPAITFPVGYLTDDAGAVLSAPVVVVSSVTDKAGAAITAHGATVNGSGAAGPISVDYDPETKGEGWIILSISQATKTVTGANATKAVFAHGERSRVQALLGAMCDADVTLAPDTLSGTMSVYASGLPHISANLLFTAALSRTSTGQPFSFDRA